MIDLDFRSSNDQAKFHGLAPYLSATITVHVASGGSVRGQLTKLGTSNLTIDGRIIALADVELVRVHVGGDWVAASPRGTALDTKLNIRCRKTEKDFLKRAADKVGQSTSEMVLTAGLDEASRVLGKPKP